jgi:BA14K-like protein
MNASMKSVVVALACFAFIPGVVTSVVAQPAVGAARSVVLPASSPDNIQQVQYRSRYYSRGPDGYRRYGYRRNNGRNIALGIGAAVIGGIVLSEAARAEHRSTHASDWDRCAQTYKSFEPSTGMYTGYDGARHTCPYLN